MHHLLTIGHSTHPIEVFINLLQQHGVTALADVRSHPYSRYFPQYSQEALRQSLTQAGIGYVFLGKELGARSENPACYRQGKVQYELLAQEPTFGQGLERLRQGMEKFRIALMCAEKDPLECHRAVLVARQMHDAGTPVQHILADGQLETHQDMELRMLELHNMSEHDMFSTREEIIMDTYRAHGEQIAYQDEALLKEELASGDKS